MQLANVEFGRPTPFLVEAGWHNDKPPTPPEAVKVLTYIAFITMLVNHMKKCLYILILKHFQAEEFAVPVLSAGDIAQLDGVYGEILGNERPEEVEAKLAVQKNLMDARAAISAYDEQKSQLEQQERLFKEAEGIAQKIDIKWKILEAERLLEKMAQYRQASSTTLQETLATYSGILAPLAATADGATTPADEEKVSVLGPEEDKTKVPGKHLEYPMEVKMPSGEAASPFSDVIAETTHRFEGNNRDVQYLSPSLKRPDAPPGMVPPPKKKFTQQQL